MCKGINANPVDGVGIRCDLFGIQEGAELWLVVLQQQSIKVEGSPIWHAVPEIDIFWIKLFKMFTLP